MSVMSYKDIMQSLSSNPDAFSRHRCQKGSEYILFKYCLWFIEIVDCKEIKF